MGTFSHPITLFDASGRRSETLEALVDTGATFSSFPAPLLERLGVQPRDTIRVRLANGTEEDWRLGQVEAALDGTRRPILCFFGSPAAPPLIGAHALEAFLLTVDPVARRLVPKEAYLL
ncbi:MAG: retroviral-like aspartic protease family protein [Chloroflexi bacterium]|nr:retroviral-like aspartic protease family protein [Chloroflexota bacterium]